jgi:hypothetical protein
MGAVKDKIKEVIENPGLTVDQKRSEIARLHARTFADTINKGVNGKKFLRTKFQHKGTNILIHAADHSDKDLSITAELERNGTVVEHLWCVRNPPIMFDAQGEEDLELSLAELMDFLFDEAHQ